MNPLTELIELLARLPGIGERTATRLAFFALTQPPSYAGTLGNALATIHNKIRPCSRCGNFGTGDLCSICIDPKRDEKILCVVARVQDLVAIERSGTFRGRYHVLHRLLAPLDGIGPNELPLDQLLARVQDENIDEVIIATPLSVEGEATALYISQALRENDTKVSRIASGIPHGGELEFTDLVTLGRAFDDRRAFSDRRES